MVHGQIPEMAVLFLPPRETFSLLLPIPEFIQFNSQEPWLPIQESGTYPLKVTKSVFFQSQSTTNPTAQCQKHRK
jgi:hypothetical protein